MSMFAKRHYETLATVVQEVSRQHAAEAYTVRDLLGDIFEKDNPSFDRARFERACVPGANVRSKK